MKTNIKTTIFTWATLVFCLGAFTVQADLDKDRDQSFPHQQMIDELGLSDQQVDQLKTIYEKNREAFKSRREQVKESHKKLREALKSDVSEAELKKLHAELQKERQALDESRFEKVLEIRNILTPEQRKKFRGLKMDRDHHKMKFNKSHQKE